MYKNIIKKNTSSLNKLTEYKNLDKTNVKNIVHAHKFTNLYKYYGIKAMF